MELNKRTKKRMPVRNPEGSVVYERSPEIQLYLEATNLKLKTDKFYESADDTLKRFILHAKTADDAFTLGLAKFCADNGLKLSPVVLLSVLSSKGYSFRGKNLNYIFNTPQRIAEAVALNNLNIKLNNSFKKNVLKVALESMSTFTLSKNQLKKRKIKTRDLIKLLRPKPSNEEQAKLYKAIIEGTAKAPKTFLRVKSDKEVSNEDKLKYFEENLEKMPVNELIRNLRFVKDHANFKKSIKLQERIMDKLSKINDFRFLNAFDLIEAALYVPEFEKMLFELVKGYALKVREEFGFKETCTFLIDRSGSMSGEPISIAFKYLVLLSQLFDKPNIRYFGNSLWSTNGHGSVLKLIDKGRLGEAFNEMSNCPDGTALIDSTKALLKDDENKNIVIISDEVTWREGKELTGAIDELSRLASDRKLILVNPCPYGGTVFKDNVMCFSSLTSNIIQNVNLHINPQGFIKVIREYGKE